MFPSKILRGAKIRYAEKDMPKILKNELVKIAFRGTCSQKSTVEIAYKNYHNTIKLLFKNYPVFIIYLSKCGLDNFFHDVLERYILGTSDFSDLTCDYFVKRRFCLRLLTVFFSLQFSRGTIIAGHFFVHLINLFVFNCFVLVYLFNHSCVFQRWHQSCLKDRRLEIILSSLSANQN